MKTKISIDLPSFAAGGVLIGALAAVSAMPLPVPFDPARLSWSALAAVVLILLTGGFGLAWAAWRRRLPPSVRLRSAAALPEGVTWATKPAPLPRWLADRALDPSTVKTQDDRADYETRLSQELAAQLRRGDAALADDLAAVFRHLALRRVGHDDVVGRLAAAAWADIAAGRRVDLAPVLRDLALPRDFGRTASADKHAFPVTRLIAALHHAIRANRFAPSDLLWLRAADETLWHAVENCGRKTFFVEALGPMAHHRAERAAGAALEAPATRAAAASVVRLLAASGDIASEG